MNPPIAQQTFGLGTLVSPQGESFPSRVSVEMEGRGIFAKIRLTFEFDNDDQLSARLFLLEKPWDAVVGALFVNGEPLSPTQVREEPRALSRSELLAVENALPTSSTNLTVVEVGEGIALSRLAIEFITTIDLQWHRGSFAFRSPLGERNLSWDGRWELSGLPGAGIAFSGAASSCRLETLEGSRYRWSEPVTVTPEEPALLDFSLDEKKAASIAVFSPSSDGTEGGCAAVAVVAPVRPQLAREPIRLAILVEIRNPQESLLIRSVIEKVATLLKPQDEFSLLLLGAESPTCLVSWGSSEAIDDELLAKLLEPSAMGRAVDLWDNMQAASSQLRTATHLLVVSSGAPTYPGKTVVSHAPVFIFTTGRRPFKSQLESLSQRTGGFLMEGSQEGLDTLLERLRIRLSPPLLSDFKLEGWALQQLRPSGATQVYTDQPTVVFGLFEGLLPKTVTLSGQSPSRQKLAQRVRVENLDEIDLMALYRERVAHWDGENQRSQRWEGDGVNVRSIGHAEELSEHYVQVSEPEPGLNPSTGIEIDMGSPTILSFSAGPVEFDDSLLGAPPSQEEFFSPSAESESTATETFEGIPEFETGESDLFYGDTVLDFSPRPLEVAEGESLLEGAAFAHDDVELFCQPLELSEQPPSEESFEQVSPSTEDSPAPSNLDAPLRPEPSTEESGKRRLLSWRQHDNENAEDREQEPKAAEPRESHGPTQEWNSQWLESFQEMDSELAQQWLEGCSIDHLGLAVSLLEATVAEELLNRLPHPRQRAVRNQVEWGRLLETFECEEADRQLALALTQAQTF